MKTRPCFSNPEPSFGHGYLVEQGRLWLVYLILDNARCHHAIAVRDFQTPGDSQPILRYATGIAKGHFQTIQSISRKSCFFEISRSKSFLKNAC